MADLDRLKAAVAKVLAPFLARIDYQALYEATVVAQNEDGSLELRPDTPKLPPLSRVGIRYGVPGIKATLNPNGHVLVGFANAGSSALTRTWVITQATPRGMPRAANSFRKA